VCVRKLKIAPHSKEGGDIKCLKANGVGKKGKKTPSPKKRNNGNNDSEDQERFPPWNHQEKKKEHGMCQTSDFQGFGD